GHNEPLDDETCTEVPGDRMRGLRTDRVQNKKPAPLKVAVRATFLRLAGLATMPLISLRRLFGALGGVSLRVGMSPGAGELALVHDEVLGANGLSREMAFEDLAGARGIAGLRRQRTARDMRGHALMRHGPPGMILGRRLRKPYVTGVARELAAFQRAHDGVAVDNLGASRVHDIAAALHHADQLVVEHALGLGMQWRVDGHNVADLDQGFDIRMEGQTQLLLDLLGQAVLVGVVKLHIERLPPPERCKADGAGSDG